MSDDLYDPRTVAVLKAAEVLTSHRAQILELANEVAAGKLDPFQLSKQMDTLIESLQETLAVAVDNVENAAIDVLVKDKYGVDEGSEGQRIMAKLALHRGAWSDPAWDAITERDAINMSLDLLSRRLSYFEVVLKSVEGGDRLKLSVDRESGNVRVVVDGDLVANLVSAYAAGTDGRASGFMGLVPRDSVSPDDRRVVLASHQLDEIDLFTPDAPGARFLVEKFASGAPSPR